MIDLNHCRTLASRLFAAGLLLASAASALADVHYVGENSANATPPYTNWATAAWNIQDAVDIAVAGDEIVVANGTYGGVGVGKPLSVRSVNGPRFTTIFGGASLTNGDTLSGFTLTHGGRPGFIAGVSGRGVWCGRRSSAVVSNCVITGNYAFASRDAYGGGAYGGTLNNCILTDNYVQDFSASAYGGGAYGCTLNNCVLSGNSAGYAFGSTAASYGFGGGAVGCTLNNCILTRNSVYSTATIFEDKGGGAYQCTLRNCILSDNWDSERWFGQFESDYSQSTAIYCLFGDPLFVDYASGNLRLQPGSPCINAGHNSYVTSATDLDGRPRIVGGTVDIGAYEFQPDVSGAFIGWLQQHRLPTDGSADYTDPDGDGVDNYHEWLAGTDPTNPLSSPAQLTIIPSGTNVILSWSTNAVGFTLQSTTNLVSPAAWTTNSPAPVVIGGLNLVTNPITGPQQFYRLSQ